VAAPASEPDPEPPGHCLTGAQRPEKCLFAEAGEIPELYPLCGSMDPIPTGRSLNENSYIGMRRVSGRL
jgi:hypothetical protein